jgi:isopentenyl diphosphate isomerase/L-lactate dehydrogenase-like FMN-dependent dehydrogenase
MIGRAHPYGLAAAGEADVRHASDILAGKPRMSMALCGGLQTVGPDRDLLRVPGPARTGHATGPMEQRTR